MKKTLTLIAVILTVTFAFCACGGGTKYASTSSYNDYYIISGNTYEEYRNDTKIYSGSITKEGRTITFSPSKDYFTNAQIRGGFVTVSYDEYTGELVGSTLTIGDKTYNKING